MQHPTTEPIQFDISSIVADIVSVMIEPYEILVTRLHAEGKLSDPDLAQLDRALREQGKHLSEKVAEIRRLKQPSRESSTKLTRSPSVQMDPTSIFIVGDSRR